jgi:3-(3-hydroxy-phenyl)propionate hydroxylase
MALSAVDRGEARISAMRELMSELLQLDAPRRHYIAMLSGLDVHYDLGAGHPLLGRRMPDLDLSTAAGPVRVFSLLRKGRGVMLNFAEPGRIDIAPWANRVPLIDATYEGGWDLPGVGQVPPPAAVLVRPDGYAAWVVDGTQAGLAEALTTWFGPPSPIPV